MVDAVRTGLELSDVAKALIERLPVGKGREATGAYVLVAVELDLVGFMQPARADIVCAQIAASTQMVAEGVKTAKSAWQLAQRHGVDVPITREVHAILYEGKPPKQAVRDLMTREAKPEFSG